MKLRSIHTKNSNLKSESTFTRDSFGNKGSHNNSSYDMSNVRLLRTHLKTDKAERAKKYRYEKLTKKISKVLSTIKNYIADGINTSYVKQSMIAGTDTENVLEYISKEEFSDYKATTLTKISAFVKNGGLELFGKKYND